MPGRSQLRRQILVDHTVDFGDGVEVTFRFDRNAMTQPWMDEWVRLEGEKNLGAINDVLASVIVSWDITEDDGTPVPVSADQVSGLFTLADKAMLVQQLLAAGRPSEEEGKGSSAPTKTPSSVSTPQPQTPPNGTAPSPSPAPLVSPFPI